MYLIKSPFSLLLVYIFVKKKLHDTYAQSPFLVLTQRLGPRCLHTKLHFFTPYRDKTVEPFP